MNLVSGNYPHILFSVASGGQSWYIKYPAACFGIMASFQVRAFKFGQWCMEACYHQKEKKSNCDFLFSDSDFNVQLKISQFWLFLWIVEDKPNSFLWDTV